MRNLTIEPFPTQEMSLTSSANTEIGVDNMLATEEGLVALTIGDLEIFSKLLAIAIATNRRCVSHTEDTLFTRSIFAEIADYEITLKRVNTLIEDW